MFVTGAANHYSAQAQSLIQEQEGQVFMNHWIGIVCLWKQIKAMGWKEQKFYVQIAEAISAIYLKMGYNRQACVFV